MPGQTWAAITSVVSAAVALQWRAGQLPGQTPPLRPGSEPVQEASMEGRAIARPNRRSRVQRPAQPAASMEGRAIARPNADDVAGQSPEPTPASMEGRAIARPNPRRTARAMGPGRASMEGRAIARPNLGDARRPYLLPQASMEGRAIARPNLKVAPSSSTYWPLLQWRAGQLPGQTVRARGAPSSARLASMEGRAIARPNLDPHDRVPAAVSVASMEGRAIARPNSCSGYWEPSRFWLLQWRAGQLPGQTSRRGPSRAS